MATMRLSIDPETKAAAHAASGRAGMRFNGWLIRLIRHTVGLSDEVPPVHELSTEDRLSASVKQATLKRKGGKA